MRISVHDFESLPPGEEPSVLVQLQPYSGPCAERPQWRGARVELDIFNGEEERIRIEGGLGLVRNMLQLALEQLNDLEQVHKEELEDHAQHSLKCTCGTYYDQRLPVIQHADGRGCTCLGDGTLLIRCGEFERKKGDGTWEPVELPDIKGEDLIRDGFHDLPEPGSPWEEFEVVEDARSYFYVYEHPSHACLAVRVKKNYYAST